MPKVDLLPHIGLLLYQHNCVIIPGLGGFVTEYRPARLNPGLSEIFPPDKAIAFNPRLERNDGLLAHSLAESHSLPYSTAEELVRQFAGNCHQRLQRDRALRFPGVGKLLLEDDGKLRFLPDDRENFLVESYGLRNLRVYPLSADRSRGMEILEPEGLDSEADGSELMPQGKKLPGYFWRWAAALVLLFVGVWQVLVVTDRFPEISLTRVFTTKQSTAIEEGRAAMLHPLIPSLQRQMNTFGPTTTLSSATPFAILPFPDSSGNSRYADADSSNTSLAWRRKIFPTAVESLSQSEAVFIEPEAITALKSGIERGDTPEKPLPSKQTETPDPVIRPTTKPSPPSPAKDISGSTQLPEPSTGYYLIIGSFPNSSEAEKRLTKITDPVGPTAVLFGSNGRYRAAILVSTDPAKISSLLEELRLRYQQPDAWVLRYSGR